MTDCVEPEALALLDVLGRVPQDVVRDNVWLHLADDRLSPSSTQPSNQLGRAFRLASRLARNLSDQLTRRLSLPDLHSSEVELLGAFLARQEGLKQLVLETNDRDNADDVSVLGTADNDGDPGLSQHSFVRVLQLGGAVSHRLQTLVLVAPAVTDTIGAAVGQHCPNLVALQVTFETLDSAFFERICHCQRLAKVDVNFPRYEQVASGTFGDSLRALAILPALDTLKLRGGAGIADLAPLSALVRVTKLDLLWLAVTLVPGGDGGTPLGHALGALTRLRKLKLPSLELENTLWGIDDDLMDTVVAQLGGLTHLAFLCIGDGSYVAGPLCDGFDALRRLAALTRLTCSAIPPQRLGGGGYLPLLQRLRLTRMLSPVALEAALQPLQPLPELREVTLSVTLDGRTAYEDVILDQDESERVQAVALCLAATGRVARALAVAPRLPRVHLRCQCALAIEVEAPQVVAAAVALLLPLQACLTTLSLAFLQYGELEGLWGILCRLSCLKELCLSRCLVSEEDLVRSVGRHMEGLVQLEVFDSIGISGSTAIVALAAARVSPLRVAWSDLEKEDYQAFKAVARPGVEIEEANEVETGSDGGCEA